MTLKDTVDDVKYDLKHSWYFRVWLLFATVCFCVDIVAMAKFSQKAKETVEKSGMRTFVEHPSQLEFPSFYLLAFNGEELTFTSSVQCKHQGMLLQNQLCEHETDFSKCVHVNAAGAFAKFPTRGQDWRTQPGFIECKFTTTIPPRSEDHDIVYAIDFKDGFTGGDGERAAFFGPNNMTIIRQDLYKITTKEHGTFNDWHLSQQYGLDVWTHGHYDVIIDMSRFFVVLHYKEGDYFDGWASAGALGGFVFLVFIVFVSAMSLLSIFMTNDSRILSGGYYKHRSISYSNPVAATSGQSSFSTRDDEKPKNEGSSTYGGI